MLEQKDCKFLGGSFVNWHSTSLYEGDMRSLNLFLDSLEKCPATKAQQKIEHSVDSLDLDDYRDRIQKSPIDAASLPPLQPLLDSLDVVKREHAPFRRKVSFSFWFGLLTGIVLKCFFFALGLVIAYGMAKLIEPQIQQRMPFEFSVLVIYLFGLYPVDIFVTFIKKRLYNAVCKPRFNQLEDSLARTDQVCRDLDDGYSDVMAKL